jgi:hypothetical protein
MHPESLQTLFGVFTILVGGRILFDGIRRRNTTEGESPPAPSPSG